MHKHYWEHWENKTIRNTKQEIQQTETETHHTLNKQVYMVYVFLNSLKRKANTLDCFISKSLNEQRHHLLIVQHVMKHHYENERATSHLHTQMPFCQTRSCKTRKKYCVNLIWSYLLLKKKKATNNSRASAPDSKEDSRSHSNGLNVAHN